MRRPKIDRKLMPPSSEAGNSNAFRHPVLRVGFKWRFAGVGLSATKAGQSPRRPQRNSNVSGETIGVTSLRAFWDQVVSRYDCATASDSGLWRSRTLTLTVATSALSLDCFSSFFDEQRNEQQGRHAVKPPPSKQSRCR
jgi:hypothetical protein